MQSQGVSGNVLQQKTIDDFSVQWTMFTDNEGYYGSDELFRDIFEPLLDISEVRGKKVADIGSGTGRIVKMLLSAGAAHVTAVEPSDACEVMEQNLRDVPSERLTCVKATGECLPPSADFDMIFSCGVLDHIPDPVPVVRAAHAALKPGGKLCVWMYSRDGNELYLSVFGRLRSITSRLSHDALWRVVRLLGLMVDGYGSLCRSLPLPLHLYFRNQLNKFSPEKRRLVIYDQLNPTFAHYFTRPEALELFQDGGFRSINLHHRHKYSWSVVAVKD